MLAFVFSCCDAVLLDVATDGSEVAATFVAQDTLVSVMGKFTVHSVSGWVAGLGDAG
ncbi:hypothetical protein [Corynebacterium cystitidis]|uniref:hypothetical protein n=1 Tax=Corynebacterium cystitidis TaxID=35757 RepID=UPI00211ECAC9|nr:hypothetical protein [Corynebacterium cystitidis]